MTAASVVGAGWHDTYFRWDISTPQRVVSRVEQLPGQGSLAQPGKKFYGSAEVVLANLSQVSLNLQPPDEPVARSVDRVAQQYVL